MTPGTGNLIAGIYSSGGVNLHPVSFYRSSDEGSSWTAIQAGRSIPPRHGRAAPSLQMAIRYAAAIGPHPRLLVPGSRQMEDNLSRLRRPLSTNGDTAFALALNPATDDLWMGTEQYGIFRSTDDGATWNVASPPDTTIDSVHGIDDGNIFAITFDRSGNVLFGSQGGSGNLLRMEAALLGAT